MGAYRFLVAGSRMWSDKAKLRTALDFMGWKHRFSNLIVVHAPLDGEEYPTGVNTITSQWCRENFDLGVREEVITGTNLSRPKIQECLAFILPGTPKGLIPIMRKVEDLEIPYRKWIA